MSYSHRRDRSAFLAEYTGGGRRGRRIFGKGLVGVLVVGIILFNLSDSAQAGVSESITFNYSGKSVRVKVYSYDPTNTNDKSHVVFKYGDLLNRAINYKNAHPNTDVHVKFVMYRMAHRVYIGVDPSHSSYGFVKNYDHGGTSSEKLSWSIVKAAKNQVHVDFVYHKNYGTEDVYTFINSYMEDPTYTDSSKKVKDYLRIRKVEWGSKAAEQMHAKFMTVSHYLGSNGKIFTDTTYATTSNINRHTSDGHPIPSWVDSGVLINYHPELMDSFEQYSGLVLEHADVQTIFHEVVRLRHALGLLNFDDLHFSSYFTPIPVGALDGWDSSFSPVAKYVEEMSEVSGNRYFKANVYHLKTDAFGQRLYDELANTYNAAGSHVRDFRFVIKTNSNEDTFSLNEFNKIGVLRYPRDTHAKNAQFAFSGPKRYFVVTGSQNLKLDEHVSKANGTVVIKEYTTAHPVYNIFKEIYGYVY